MAASTTANPTATPSRFRSQSQRLLAGPGVLQVGRPAATSSCYNPACEIELPKVEQRLPCPALTAGRGRAGAGPVRDLAEPTGLRDRAMLEVLYSTGIRRSELAHLAVFDLDVERADAARPPGQGPEGSDGPDRRPGRLPGSPATSPTSDHRLVVEPDDGAMFVSADGLRVQPRPAHPDRPPLRQSDAASPSRGRATCSVTRWRR